jgi:hypothetical protein
VGSVAPHRLDPGDFETTGPLECSECSGKSSRSLRIITVGVDGVASIEWLEGRIRVAKFSLILLTPVYFLFMLGEMAPINMASCISEVVDVCSDILFNFLVSCGIDVLRRVVDNVPPSSAIEELSTIVLLVDEAALAMAAIGSWRGGSVI